MNYFQNSPNINTTVQMIGNKLAAVWGPLPKALWEVKSRVVWFGGAGPGGQGVVWEIIVRVRVDTNISMLDVYSRALRPALSINEAAMATEKRRTKPTMAASYLTDT